jgi:DNA-binding transcriptional LysR family regulator
MAQTDFPGWSAIRGFVVAARRRSFRAAAAELGVTPSAVSHQVSALERALGVQLFERAPGRVIPTHTGERLAQELGAAIDLAEQSLARAAKSGLRNTLRIASLPLFTTVWLAPRLERFSANHGDVVIEIESSNRIVELEAEGFDVAIRNADPGGGHYESRKLLDLRARPLCSASVAASLTSPADLADAKLIHINAGRAGWKDWLALNGLPALIAQGGLKFDSFPAAIEAAVNGRGVMLGLEPIIWESSSASGLVAPFGSKTYEAGCYHVVWRKSERNELVLRSFIEWLFAEMRRDVRRLAKKARAAAFTRSQ